MSTTIRSPTSIAIFPTECAAPSIRMRRRTDGQLALFVDTLKDSHVGEAGAEFDNAVRGIIGAAKSAQPDSGLDESDAPQENGKPRQ